VSHLRANVRVFRDVHEIDVNMLGIELSPVAYEYRTTRQMNSSPGEQACDLNSDLLDTDVKIVMAINDGDCMRSGPGIYNVTAHGRVTGSTLRSVQGQYLLAMALRRPDYASSAAVYSSARR